MITLDKLLMELKPESMNEIIAGSQDAGGSNGCIRSGKNKSSKTKSGKSGKSSSNKSGKNKSGKVCSTKFFGV